jgi:hypothetical protein
VNDVDPSSAHIALLDACALIPIRLTTALLWLAEAGLFEVLWSDVILDEVERNLPKVGISSKQAACVGRGSARRRRHAGDVQPGGLPAGIDRSLRHRGHTPPTCF